MKMTFIKYLQRKTYDVLSDRPLILCIVVILLAFFVICQVFEIYIISSRSILKAVCDSKCCDNVGAVCASCDPIDAVYTWVNGSDPVWLSEITKYASDEGYSKDDFDLSRYDDKQELKYSLRSLELYAPWVRKVYIVTAGQLPWWLDIWNPKVKIITHDQIIPQEYLPTFSSPAIECFLHNIPGLSDKFLYFNDDVFLGGPLHLTDLYTETEGYEVYTAWNVPDCAQGCPWSFLGDKSCDQPCNNNDCDFDGGDCSGEPKSKHYGIGNSLDYLDDYADNPFFDEDHYPNVEKYPGFDEPAFDSQVVQARQHEDQNILDNLRAGRKYGESVKVIKSEIEDDFWGVKKDDAVVEERKSMRGLKSVQLPRGSVWEKYKSELDNLGNKVVNASHKVQSTGNITNNNNNTHAVNEKPKVNLISLLVGSKNNLNVSGLVDNYNKNYLKADRKSRRKSNNDPFNNKHTDERKLSMYAKSLIYTNKIFNKAYGFQNRKVPAHVPFLLEKGVIRRLQDKFKQYVEITAKNKFRRGNDFQFSFSYYHYLLSEKRELTIEEIFDKYDTDKSGTWSDREVRTVLARVRGLPLTLEVVRALEAAARQCEKEEYRVHPTPVHERYLDSEMPTLTKALIVECDSIRKPLMTTLRSERPRAVARPAGYRHTFAMLESNITKAVNSLDEIRRDTKKFICINDNLDPRREEESAIVGMMLQELYEALLPIPSQFELPQGVGNRFLRLSDLKDWREGRMRALIGLTICAVLLLLISLYHIKSFIRNTINRINHLL